MATNRAIILAAGEGTRMRPLTYTRPKGMLPIANKPILEHLLREMIMAGIEDYVFVVGYHDEQIRSYFADGAKWGIKIRYVSQRKQSGTADALRLVEGLVKGDFMVVNGDVIITHQDIKRLAGRDGCAMGIIEREEVAGVGVVEIKDGRIIRIHEKVANPPSHLVNTGLYLFTPAIFEAIKKTEKSRRGEYEITDSIQLLIDGGQIMAGLEIGGWLDFSYPWDLLAANERILGDLEPARLGVIEENVVIRDPVAIGKGTTIRSGAYIVGPVVIGQNCDIGPNCFIRPASAIADNCHIGAAVEVKNSIIMTGTKIPHLNYVGDSLIGENCNLGAGTKIANLRLDKRNVAVNGIDTRRRKFGAVIGDNVEIGINAAINVGTSIGNDTFIGPGALAHGVIAPQSKIF
jgi:UDP-N-acetylglucosamine diphosphorylase/glucosamine-1-phosphate N-acetyltransferase